MQSIKIKFSCEKVELVFSKVESINMVVMIGSRIKKLEGNEIIDESYEI